MRSIFAIVVATCNLVAVRSTDNATYVLSLHRCHGQQEYLEKCIKNTIESLRPYLASGLPSFNIPSFEPYYMVRSDFFFRDRFNGTATFKDIIIHGLTNFAVNNVQATLDMRQIKFDMYFPHIQLYAFYEIIGEIYRIPIKRQEDNMTEDFLDITAQITIDGVYDENRDELKYFKEYTVSVELNVKDGNTKKRNLYRSKRHEAKPKSDNSLLEVLFTMFAPELRHKVQTTISEVISKNANKVHFKHPMAMMIHT